MTIGSEGSIDAGLVASLYVQHAEELRAFLTGVLRNADLASEALQSTFVKAIESGHTASPDSLKGWLFRVAFNEALVIRRRARVHERSFPRVARPPDDGTVVPDEHLVRWESVERVRRALAGLPDEQQDVVRRRIYEDKTFAVIAAELDLPLGTVLTRMRLALQRLRRALESESKHPPRRTDGPDENT